jgi:hypothetical protein
MALRKNWLARHPNAPSLNVAHVDCRMSDRCARALLSSLDNHVADRGRAGMQDYRLDAIEQPHAAAVDRLTGRGVSAPVDCSGGELPGRKGRSQTLAVVMPAPIATSANETDDTPSQDRWRNHAANNGGEPEEDFVDLYGR